MYIDCCSASGKEKVRRTNFFVPELRLHTYSSAEKSESLFLLNHFSRCLGKNNIPVKNIFCILSEVGNFLRTEFGFKLCKSFLEMKPSSACVMGIRCKDVHKVCFDQLVAEPRDVFAKGPHIAARSNLCQRAPFNERKQYIWIINNGLISFRMNDDRRDAFLS